MLAGPKNGMAASRSRLNGPVGTGVRTRCPTVCRPLNSVLQVKSADAVAYRDFGARWVRSPAPSSCDAAPPVCKKRSGVPILLALLDGAVSRSFDSLAPKRFLRGRQLLQSGAFRRCVMIRRSQTFSGCFRR